MKEKQSKRTRKILAWQVVAALLLTLAIGTLVYSVPSFREVTGMSTFNSKGCSNNQICDVITECTPTGGCSSTYENCKGCGSTVKICGEGVVSAPNVCSELGGAPTCVNSQPVCTSPLSSDPYQVLTFNVFTKKNIVANITPTSQAGLAGSTLNYKMSVQNKNPVSVEFLISTEIPPNWAINIPDRFTIPADGNKDVVIRVTSNETASDNSYPILIGLFNQELNIFGTVEAAYIVASRGAPGVNTTPRVNKGYPGQTIMYNVTVTNNDPADFDASTITLKAVVPGGFNAVFTPSSIKVPASQSASVKMDVTSPANASEKNYPITVNATENKLTGLDFVEYEVDLCGNNVCDFGEENTCIDDCPIDPYIYCNGRCETELDDGLRFSAIVSVPFSKFIICNRNITTTACANAAKINSCGIDKACLCNSATASCDVRCVDKKSVYFVMVNGSSGTYRTIANYSYACPWVDLPDFIKMRDDFVKAKQDYEQAQSALREYSRAPNATLEQKAANQPCIDALGTMIGDLDEFVKYLNLVIAWPGKMNTTAARIAADDVRQELDRMYNSYCQGVSGLLQITSIDTPLAEKGTTVQVSVIAQNIGDSPYYGYASCDLTGGSGEKFNANSTCDLIGGGQSNLFAVPVAVTSAGTWKTRCKLLGSLNSDCSVATIHDDKSGNFTAFTKETYVADVSGVCSNSQVNCSVRTLRSGCGMCSLDGVPCTRTGSVNNTDLFRCSAPVAGTYTLTATVLDNSNCKPIEPAAKNTTVRCAGCGDGIVDTGELCELPYTDGNTKCIQQETTCQGKLYSVRDKFGFCDLSCGCAYDDYAVSCTRGKCGAECEDGETRVVTLNKTGGTCTCTQQCGSACGWNACDCEPGTTGPPTGTPTVSVSHSPQNPTATTPVTLTATGQRATIIEIYVDGYITRTCNAFPCSVTATYEPGVHSYFARAFNSLGIAFDPAAGSKSFTIPGSPGSGNGTGNGTGLNVTSVMLDVGHSPSDITPATTVMVSAVGNGPRSFREIVIYVDSVMKKKCENYPRSLPCTYRATYLEGTHTYYATAIDTASVNVRDPASGSDSFTVSGEGGGSGGGGGTGVNTSGNPQGWTNTTRGKCGAIIDKKSCTYNALTRRYDLFMSASWENGTHAHWKIEDNTGPKVYSNKFNRTEQMAGPGLKNLRLEVHNENDTVLCYATEGIYCGPGTATGRDIDIIIDVKDVVQLGSTPVRIIAIPYKDISLAGIFTYTDYKANLTNLHVQGNSSIAGLSGPGGANLNGTTYNLVTLTTSMNALKNISVIYTMNVNRAGSYEIIVYANYSGKSERYSKNVVVTNCAQTGSVLAKQGDACKQFPTVCDMPPGWTQVTSCNQTLEPPKDTGESPLGAAIAVVVIAIVLAFGYKFKDQITDKLTALRSRGKEETPSIEFEE